MVQRKRVYAIRGGSLKSFLNSVNEFFKKTKIVSTVGKALAPLVPGPYRGLADSGIDFLEKQGYGKKRRSRRFLGVGRRRRTRRTKAGALRLAGGAVRRTRMRKTYY